MQIEWKWWGRLSRDNLKHKFYTTRNLWEEAPLFSLWYIMCLFIRTTSKCHFSLKLLSGSPKTRTFTIPKLWTPMSFSNQISFENERAISYSPWKYLSNSVYYGWIEPHLTPAFKGFVVGSQIPYLTTAPSFDHNSCKSSLNEQCKATLSIYASRPFWWWLGGPILCFFAFPTKVLNICNSRMNATPKMEVHLGVIGLHPLHSPPFVKVCFTPKHTFGLMGPYTSHLVMNPMLGLRHFSLDKSILKHWY